MQCIGGEETLRLLLLGFISRVAFHADCCLGWVWFDLGSWFGLDWVSRVGLLGLILVFGWFCFVLSPS